MVIARGVMHMTAALGLSTPWWKCPPQQKHEQSMTLFAHILQKNCHCGVPDVRWSENRQGTDLEGSQRLLRVRGSHIEEMVEPSCGRRCAVGSQGSPVIATSRNSTAKLSLNMLITQELEAAVPQCLAIITWHGFSI